MSVYYLCLLDMTRVKAVSDDDDDDDVYIVMANWL